ncbi:hypothetical protein [Phyllobacterium sp. OV277]|uniref:hypothetical protein n=1 Tax=Phyllobacterium sp. OV277 TaxID=1882772 RepID=UPI0008812D2D|nr:hypothetical protein [Phyllobacterium sp. OV277]SDP69555.1 hypothetical protein SAMN05443582_10861 [Phyllobacterium sp. OV277]
MNKYLEKHPAWTIAFVLGAAVALSYLTMPTAHSASSPKIEDIAAAEKNPLGDIPDSQVFTDYHSALGFSLKVPEGWARKDGPDGVSFTDKFNGVAVVISPAASTPSIESIKLDYLPKMEASGRAVKVIGVRAVKATGGNAILITFSSDSEPNTVTNKQIRLENRRYLFFKNGKIAELDLYAPFGADNIDQWRLMSQSFRWQ